MVGGGLGDFEPGEWTDDTAMAWAVLDVAATGADLRSPDALTAIAQRFRDWYDSGPAEIGSQTRAVLGDAGPRPTGAALTEASDRLHARTGHTAGNGSLMRTAAVALPYLDDPHAQEACALWSLAIRHAVVHGELDVRSGLALLDADAADYWTARLDEAEQSDPGRFRPNGWAVAALQAAWSAIVRASADPGDDDDSDPWGPLDAGLVEAIRIGDDTDTVAAIAGALLGARYGASAVPARWRRILHGYPGLTGEQLVGLAHLAATAGRPGAHGWPLADRIDYSAWLDPAHPTLVRHPHDDGVWLGDAAALDALPDDVTAVVSLCLVGRTQVPDSLEHVGYRLIDEPDPAVNPNLEFVLIDAADTVADLRDDGHVVLLHCVAAQSRTPTVAIAYAMRRGVQADAAHRDVLDALPAARPDPGFRRALQRLGSREWLVQDGCIGRGRREEGDRRASR